MVAKLKAWLKARMIPTTRNRPPKKNENNNEATKTPAMNTKNKKSKEGPSSAKHQDFNTSNVHTSIQEEMIRPRNPSRGG